MGNLFDNLLNQTADKRNPFSNVASGSSSSARDPRWGLRPDGTPKDVGFLGPLQLPNGAIASEYSIPLWEEGNPGDSGYRRGPDIPTLVPTLTPDEVNLMVNQVIPNNGQIPQSIVDKAIAHAKKRMAGGMSPFYSSSEGQR